MVGASPSAFSKFLQFFYNYKIDLTMEDVEDVMSLIDRYDVESAWPICVEYSKENLTVNDILWGLSMAKKFRLDDLKSYCLNKIQQNCSNVCKMIELDNNSKPKLRSNPNNRALSDADLAEIFPEVFELIGSTSSVLDYNYSHDFSFMISTGEMSLFNRIEQVHYITFGSSEDLMLVAIDFNQLFEYINDERTIDTQFISISGKVLMWINEEPNPATTESVLLITHQFELKMTGNNNYVLEQPIKIKKTSTYRLHFSLSEFNPPAYCKSSVPSGRYYVGPGLHIAYVRSDLCNETVLVKTLHFNK